MIWLDRKWNTHIFSNIVWQIINQVCKEQTRSLAGVWTNNLTRRRSRWNNDYRMETTIIVVERQHDIITLYDYYCRTIGAHCPSGYRGRGGIDGGTDRWRRWWQRTGDGPDVRGTEPLWREKRLWLWREKPSAVRLGLCHIVPVDVNSYLHCTIIILLIIDNV